MFRLLNGYTQESLALALGEERPLVTMFERGTRQPSAVTLQKIGDLFCLDPLFLRYQTKPIFTKPALLYRYSPAWLKDRKRKKSGHRFVDDVLSTPAECMTLFCRFLKAQGVKECLVSKDNTVYLFSVDTSHVMLRGTEGFSKMFQNLLIWNDIEQVSLDAPKALKEMSDSELERYLLAQEALIAGKPLDRNLVANSPRISLGERNAAVKTLIGTLARNKAIQEIRNMLEEHRITRRDLEKALAGPGKQSPV